jgi:DNA-binding CsgD family transcriptional regulator
MQLRVGRLVQEVRDPWAIALVEVTAVAAYFFAAAPLWQAILAAPAVLAVRILVGLAMPVPGYRFDPLSLLTRREMEIAILVCRDLTSRQIGERLALSERAVRNHLTRILRKLDLSDRKELKEVAQPWIPDVPAPRYWYERSVVRGTLAAAGFVGFGWTSYQIITTILRLLPP